MKRLEDHLKDFLEEMFNQSLSKRETKKISRFFFEKMFDSLIENQEFCFPKGFGSLRIKNLKPFSISKSSGECIIIKDRQVVRYFPGRELRRRVPHGREQ